MLRVGLVRRFESWRRARRAHWEVDFRATKRVSVKVVRAVAALI